MLDDRILIVDDDPSWQELLAETIEGLGVYDVRVAGSYAEADALLDRQHFHLAFVDLRLREDARELEGKQIARKIVDQDEGTSIVIATGHADVEHGDHGAEGVAGAGFRAEGRVGPRRRSPAWCRPASRPRRAAYRGRYESAVDVAARAISRCWPWVAQVLQAVAPDTAAARPDRRLGDFLNVLLARAVSAAGAGRRRRP